jgi:predicted permease
MVSASFLDVLGVQPVAGRNFTAAEDQSGAPPVAIIDYAFWQQRFGGRPDAVASPIVLNGKGYTVVGILPAGFQFLDSRPILTPIGQSDEIWMQKRDAHPGIQAIARLKAGMDVQTANVELRVIGTRVAQAYPETDSKFTFRALSLREQIVGQAGRALILLGGAVGLVLLIACVNVASLFLARSVSREREFSLRAALGATRLRLSKQLLTESLMLSLSGGIVGLLIAGAGTRWAIARLPHWLPRMNDVAIDVRVLLFALAISILCGLAFGIAPAFRQRTDLETHLRQAHGSGAGIRRIHGLFVVAELALAFVLLAGAGLMLRSIQQLWNVSPGFDPHNVLTMGVALPPTNVKNPSLIRNGWQQTLERVRNTPGVEAAAIDSITPLSGESQHVAYWTTAEKKPPKSAARAWLFTPTPDYLRTMKIPLLRGRFFSEQDRVGSAPVVVIDDTLAKRLFPDRNAVDNELSVQFMGRVRIIGVVGAIKHLTLDEDAYTARQPAIYIPFLEFPDDFMQVTTTGMNLLVRTSTNALALLPVVKNSVVGPERDTPVRDPATMEQLIGYSTAQRSGMALLLGIFAALALALSAIGIYSVISYAMSQRIQEIAIRMALGAETKQVLRLVLAQGLRMITAGVVVGMVASFALMRLLAKLLFGVTAADPMAFAAAVVALCAIALFAIYFPARRAAKIDPALTLRYS